MLLYLGCFSGLRNKHLYNNFRSSRARYHRPGIPGAQKAESGRSRLVWATEQVQDHSKQLNKTPSQIKHKDMAGDNV